MYKFTSPSKNVLDVELHGSGWQFIQSTQYFAFCGIWWLNLSFFSDKSICLVYAFFFLNKKGENYTMWPSMTKIVSDLT